MISTQRHVDYALGYVGLGMLNEASDELEAIALTDRFLPEVLVARIEFHMAAKHWETVVGLGRELSGQRPKDERAWITWAYALRELNQIVEAQRVLLQAEPHHGKTSAILHYNLACYHSLLGDGTAALSSLARACRMDKSWKDAALDDQDLKPLWNEIAAMR